MNNFSNTIYRFFPWILVLVLFSEMPIHKSYFYVSVFVMIIATIHILGKYSPISKLIAFLNYKPGLVDIQITNQEKDIIKKNKSRHFLLYYENAQGIGVEEEITLITENITDNVFQVQPDTLRAISEICNAEVHFQHYNQQVRTEVFIGSINLIHKINDTILDYYDQVKPEQERNDKRIYQQRKRTPGPGIRDIL